VSTRVSNMFKKKRKKEGVGVIPCHERLWDKQVLGEKRLNTGT